MAHEGGKNINKNKTKKTNNKCRPYLFVIGGGLGRIGLLFKRME
jgi:hypothetical protein